jgi:nitrogen fixation protein NifQ
MYRMLTGRSPGHAAIADDADFDRHVLASILAVAAAEPGALTQQTGLSAIELSALLAQDFPGLIPALALQPCGASGDDDDEVEMLRDLLLANRSTAGDCGRWLAAMVARRALEPNHLWEDLGLRDRSELSRLLLRHFAPLAQANVNNMRWKRFFYRSLCEGDGLVMCTTPVCAQCGDFDLCFGEESGESRMAERRRALAVPAFAVPSPPVCLE